MKLITRDTDYALRAICFMVGRCKKKVTVGELAEELKMPRPFLRKILQQLNKSGILSSYRGGRGGFVISKDLSSLTLLDLIEVFQGPFTLNECNFKKKECPNTKSCPLREKICEIEEYVLTKLKSVNLESLLAEAGGSNWQKEVL